MKVLLSKLRYDRKENFRIKTDVVENDNGKLLVIKYAMSESSWNLLSSIKDISSKLHSGKSVSLAPIENIDNKAHQITFKYIHGETVESLIEQSLLNRDYESAKQLYKKACGYINAFSSKATKEEQEVFTKWVGAKADNISVGTDFLPITDISLDHLIINKKGEAFLFDYENFLDILLPSRYIQFRAEFYLLNNLKQILSELASSEFKVMTYLNSIYIPEQWLEVNNFTHNEKAYYLKAEERLQNYLNWKSIELDNYLDYSADLIQDRVSSKLTVGRYALLQETEHKQRAFGCSYDELIERNEQLRKEFNELHKQYTVLNSSKYNKFRQWIARLVNKI